MVELINGFAGYKVVWEANHGKELTQKLQATELPQIVFLDIAMPKWICYRCWLNRIIWK
jgi:CheY-like chemotaxis protein